MTKMASMKIAALLFLGMVLVASAAEVAEDKAARPTGINADQVIPGRFGPYAYGRFDPIMHQRRLQTFFGWGGFRPFYGGFPGYYGGFGGSGASASATASSGPFGSSASAAASAGNFGFPGGFGGFGFFG